MAAACPTTAEVTEALLELDSKSDLKGTLAQISICGAREIDIGGKKATVVLVPVPQWRTLQRVHSRLVRELEKKFSRHVVFLAQRRILAKPTRRSRQKQLRPRSRTLTHVHESILGDLVYPAEVVGRRTRVKLDGSSLIKVHLDKSQQTNVEHKLDTFTTVYKKLTGKDVSFEFPTQQE